MAITYSVCQTREESAGYSKGSGRDALSIGWAIGFRVEVSDPADPTFAPEDITAVEVALAPGLPVVNQSIYYYNGRIIPYLVCRDKQVERNPDNPFWFDVTCRYDTGERGDNQEGDNQPITPPNALTDIAPREEAALGVTERVLYDDLAAVGKPCETPTRNLYDEPFIAREPTLRLRITQYEASITYEQMLERKLRTNENTYRTKPEQTWLISEVEATEVTVQLAGGPTVAALVTYTLELAANNEAPDDWGWKDQRALIDTHFYDPANGLRKTAYVDPDGDGQTFTVVKLKGDGSGTPLDDQNAAPEYDEWQVYRTIDFATFLQV